MTWAYEVCLFGAVVLLLLASGQWIAFALGIGGMFAIIFGGGFQALQPLGYVLWHSCSNFNITAIPLFILMGELIVASGVTDRFYRNLGLWFNRVPGGLLQANIVASAIFAAITGVSVASAGALGTVAIPSQRRLGYNERMIFGSITGGGALAILIPPSVPLIIYGAMTENSVVKLFSAGIIPGIVLTAIFMIYIGIKCLLRPGLAPRSATDAPLSIKIAGLTDVVPVLFIALLMLFGIYFGWMTPTEAGAVGALCGAILIPIYSKGPVGAHFSHAFKNSIKVTCMLLSIMIGAQILAFSLVSTGINREMTEWIVAMNFPKYWFIAAVYFVYLVLGCFMDPISILFLTLPIVYPIVVALEFSPIWFGIVLVVWIEIGLLTPPVGMNLFIVHGISGGSKFKDVVMGSVPYILMMGFFVFILTVFKAYVR
jgi:C4-dicarboxylate transporter DctM subunit